MMHTTRLTHLAAAALAVNLLFAPSALAGRPGTGQLYYEGQLVRTLVPPAAMTKPGKDNLYVVMEGAEGQEAVAAVAPGDQGYHGGKWAVHAVTWNVEPYLLTSEAEVLAAELLGDVQVVRMPAADFKCPIQP